MSEDQRLSSGHEIDATEAYDHALRPKKLVDFIGQGAGRQNLETFIAAARGNGSYPFAWSPWPWQNDDGADYRW